MRRSWESTTAQEVKEAMQNHEEKRDHSSNAKHSGEHAAVSSADVPAVQSANTDAAAMAIREINRARPMIRNWKKVVAALRTIT